MNAEFFSSKYSLNTKDYNDAALSKPQHLPYDKQLRLGEVNVSDPLVFKLERGKRNRDLIGAYGMSFLVSEKFIGVLKENNLTGWTTYPVELYDKNDIPIKSYYGFAVTGRSGPPDSSRSYRKKFPPYGEGLLSYEEWAGLFFDEDSWDQSDLFVPETTLYICLTGRVKDILEKAGLTNIRFERLDEIKTPSTE